MRTENQNRGCETETAKTPMTTAENVLQSGMRELDALFRSRSYNGQEVTLAGFLDEPWDTGDTMFEPAEQARNAYLAEGEELAKIPWKIVEMLDRCNRLPRLWKACDLTLDVPWLVDGVKFHHHRCEEAVRAIRDLTATAERPAAVVPSTVSDRPDVIDEQVKQLAGGFWVLVTAMWESTVCDCMWLPQVLSKDLCGRFLRAMVDVLSYHPVPVERDAREKKANAAVDALLRNMEFSK